MSSATVTILVPNIKKRKPSTSTLIANWFTDNNFSVQSTNELENRSSTLSLALSDACRSSQMVVIAGGTGVGPENWTIDVITSTCDFEIPGIGEYLRLNSLKFSANALLSRCGAWRKGSTVILAVPGNPEAAIQQLEMLGPYLTPMINAVLGNCEKRQLQRQEQPESRPES